MIENKFEFDTQNEKCWYWTKKGEKKEVEKDLKTVGDYNGQRVFRLDREHKDHWINYRLTYFKSADKVLLDAWYKKRVEDSSIPEGVRFVHYKKRLEKLADIIVIEFTKEDEMVKVFDKKTARNRYSNRLEWEKQNQTQST